MQSEFGYKFLVLFSCLLFCFLFFLLFETETTVRNNLVPKTSTLAYRLDANPFFINKVDLLGFIQLQQQHSLFLE